MHIEIPERHDNCHIRNFKYFWAIRCISETILIVSRYSTTFPMRTSSSYYIEICIWTCSIIFLAIINPDLSGAFTACPLHHLGFDNCPGCGLGRSVSYLLHADVAASVETHVLGIPATVILIHRIVTLITRRNKSVISHRTIIS